MNLQYNRAQALALSALLALAEGHPAQGQDTIRYSTTDTVNVSLRIDSHPMFYGPDSTFYLKWAWSPSNWTEASGRCIRLETPKGARATLVEMSGDTLTISNYYSSGGLKKRTKELIGDAYAWLYDGRWCEDGFLMWSWNPSAKGYQEVLDYDCNRVVRGESRRLGMSLCGRYARYFPNGAEELVGNYVECDPTAIAPFSSGCPDGTWRSYSENGTLLSEWNYVNCLQDGSTRQFHNNGKLAALLHYEAGELKDVLEYYDSSGKPLGHGTFSKGSGELPIYDEDGRVIRTDVYVNGQRTKN